MKCNVNIVAIRGGRNLETDNKAEIAAEGRVYQMGGLTHSADALGNHLTYIIFFRISERKRACCRIVIS